MISSVAWPMIVAANFIERPECEPPPAMTRLVSWATYAMLSNGTPSHSVTSCAKLVSWPCPEFIVPMTSSTLPSGSTVISVRSRGAPEVIST